MKLLQNLKSMAILMLLMGFFFSATVTSCGNKKSESTEQVGDHPEEDAEHPEEADEHPSDDSEHPE